ncbi:MAG: hypothetical protein GEU77_11370 [Deltaproteobacteria bacterium]|nr:hypothetical protein [Deltaproteobacteria bacterium]
MESKCRIEVANFLEFRADGSFDRIASVGAAEHVPQGRFDDYWVRAFELLRPAANFSITRSCKRPACKNGRAAYSWIVMFFPIIFSPPSGARSQPQEAPASKRATLRVYANTTCSPCGIGYNDPKPRRTRLNGKPTH